MPRKYDRTIRYYASWFADLQDPSKEFTSEEKWQVVIAIANCQLQGSLQPLEALPLSIRRALSMATLGEQIIRQLERAENMRARGSAGGRAAASRAACPEQAAAAAMKEEQRDKNRQEREEQHDNMMRSAVKQQTYEELLVMGAKGDETALKQLDSTIDECKTLCARKNLKY